MNTYITSERTRLRWREGIKRKVYRRRAPKCPVCHGLECLCRPRYFSGQLLTEADLNAEQQYVIKKNRLHNLYLHGWGVVCGLEVLCHPTCDGWVTVKQGYAISPCGDDIVVCEDSDFDVVKAIEECERQQRRQPVDCAPRATAQADCDPDGCWYLMLTYKEDATRAITSLRRDTEACTTSCDCAPRGCGCAGRCGCGGSAYSAGGRPASAGCGCGCGGKGTGVARTSGSTRATMARALPPPACEPTRLCESFTLELCKAPDETDDDTYLRHTEILEDTLLGRIQVCVEEIRGLLALAPTVSMGAITPVAGVAVATGTPQNLTALYQDCCKFLQAVRAYFEGHPTTHCSLLDELAMIQCPQPPQPGFTGMNLEGPNATAVFAGLAAGYQQAVAETVTRIQGLLVRALIDCICLQLMPPCPEDPGDERIYLGCITVKDGKVDHICNFKCRKHVWTWPTVLYWMSIVPVVPLISQFIEQLCCGEDKEWAGALLTAKQPAYNVPRSGAAPSSLTMLQQLLGAGMTGGGGLSGIGAAFGGLIGGFPHA